MRRDAGNGWLIDSVSLMQQGGIESASSFFLYFSGGGLQGVQGPLTISPSILEERVIMTSYEQRGLYYDLPRGASRVIKTMERYRERVRSLGWRVEESFPACIFHASRGQLVLQALGLEPNEKIWAITAYHSADGFLGQGPSVRAHAVGVMTLPRSNPVLVVDPFDVGRFRKRVIRMPQRSWQYE